MARISKLPRYTQEWQLRVLHPHRGGEGWALLCFALVICYSGLAVLLLLVGLMLRNCLDRERRELRDALESQRQTLRELEVLLVRDRLAHAVTRLPVSQETKRAGHSCPARHRAVHVSLRFTRGLH